MSILNPGRIVGVSHLDVTDESFRPQAGKARVPDLFLDNQVYDGLPQFLGCINTRQQN